MQPTEQLPSSANLAFVEQLYAEYLRNPAGVPPEWRAYFDRFSTAGHDRFGDGTRLGPSFRTHSIFNPPAPRTDGNGHVELAGPQMRPLDRAAVGAAPLDRGEVNLPAGPRGAAPAERRAEHHAAVSQDRVDQLVRAYRVRGHIIAQVSPLWHRKPDRPELKPSYYGFTAADLDRVFSTRTLGGQGRRTLRDILFTLRNTYCRSIGVQFMHIDSLEARHWLQERMESTQNRLQLAREEQLRILTRLTDAVTFEEFIQKKYIGAKRFSLEGGETLIPLLDLAIEHVGAQGVEELVIGMAHRGRLNVLANIMGKSPREIFRQFADIDAEFWLGRGDVKYHQGYHGDWTTAAGRQIHLALCFNPSHLEYVNPVALGRTRAKQDRLGDTAREHSMTLLIHGDAAFAGQGVVQETLNLSELQGYRVGGTLHVIVNNELGFTTTPEEGRSTVYATDVAKMLQSPIFHVNGEDPEAVAQVVRLALDFRRTFRRDVVIDMYCYRRWGHNESDEPSFTQPLMYRQIENRPSVRDAYCERLVRMGGVTQTEVDDIAARRRRYLEEELSGVAQVKPGYAPRESVLGKLWGQYHGGPDGAVPEPQTGVPVERLAELFEKQTVVPPDFHVHPKLKRFLDQRRAMARGERPLDWSAAEALAFATLVTEGARVRLSGQDSARGTFSQRHAILHDHQDGRPYLPLQHLAPEQAPFNVYNSPLSEAGVLGFEYGYSIACPDGLILWEAQFGDFVNAAQVYVDQFLASAEDKWHSLSGLVLLLPHGLEGQGPEHSSARLERFLMLAATDNLQVVNPTTPAQYFHVLRRQVIRPWRKPLVVLTPKSLLRHPQATSTLADLATGQFQRILPDPAAPAPDQVTRILLCSGKVYYDLVQERTRRRRSDAALIRIEQYYPLGDDLLRQALAPYPPQAPVFWVQEEPANAGGWPHFRQRYCNGLFGRPFRGISRPPAAAPATGSAAAHKLEQDRLLARAFDE
ncbi:MAG: 2-oxoglutarate dehydrogenase E1 component [Planctomycetota bacterium]